MITLLTIGEVAAVLRVTEAQAKAAGIPAIRMGRPVLYDARDVISHMEKQQPELVDLLRRTFAAEIKQKGAQPIAIGPRRTGEKFVYFARASGRIKIGSAVDVNKRLASLRTGVSTQLEFLGAISGGQPKERAIHEQWAHLRVRGEWFRAAPDLIAFIKGECQP